MKRRRLTELLVAHALTEGTSVGLALRQSGGPLAIAGAAKADAGQLLDALRTARITEGQALLAEAWPAAAVAALRRLDRLPDLRVKQAQLQEVLAYLFVVAGIQAAALALLSSAVVEEGYGAMGAGLGSALGWFPAVIVSLLALEAGLVAAASVVVWRPESVPGWGRARRRARGAALAAAMQEAGAPSELWRTATDAADESAPVLATEAELQLLFETALASEEAGHQRLLAGVRAVGLGLLAAVAAATTVAVYSLQAALAGIGG